MIMDHYPEALDIKDNKGNVPLHRAFMTPTEMFVLVRLAHANNHALNRINKKGKLPLDIATLAVEKEFNRARKWYNIRLAFCPCCVRRTFPEYDEFYNSKNNQDDNDNNTNDDNDSNDNDSKKNDGDDDTGIAKYTKVFV